MSQMQSQAPSRYSPLYFLTSLGAGGLVVTFFMWFLFWIPHPGRVVPVFEDVAKVFANASSTTQSWIILGYAGVAVFALLSLYFLIWNLRQLTAFSKTQAFASLINSNNETQLVAAPLATAMAVNVGFIVGLLFVPGLWSLVEYLFPLAMLAFLAIGFWALRRIGRFWSRVLVNGGFKISENNSLAQLLPAFSLAMVGVGLAAPAAMSSLKATAMTSYVLSSFFLLTAVVLISFKLVLGFHSMLDQGLNRQAAPTLMILVPVITVMAITWMRQQHGLHVFADAHTSAAGTFQMLTGALVLQVAILMFGITTLIRNHYLRDFVFGPQASAGSYTLVCPGVAFSIMLQFWINKGLVAAGIIAKFGAVYWGLTWFAIAVQLVTIALVFALNYKHFWSRQAAATAIPA